MQLLSNAPYIDDQFDQRFSCYPRTYHIIEKMPDLEWWMIDGHQYLMQLCCVRATFSDVVKMYGLSYKTYDDYIFIAVPTKIVEKENPHA